MSLRQFLNYTHAWRGEDLLPLALCVTLEYSNAESFHLRWKRLYLLHECVKCNRQTTKSTHTVLHLIFTIKDASFWAQGSDPSLVWVELLLIFIWNWKSWHRSHDHWEQRGFLLVPTCHPAGTSQTSHSLDAPFFPCSSASFGDLALVKRHGGPSVSPNTVKCEEQLQAAKLQIWQASSEIRRAQLN